MMHRRDFIRTGGLGATALSISGIHSFSNPQVSQKKHAFHLNYAPHVGMFANSAGTAILDQLRFMAERGFSAFEDNEMRNRPIAEQRAIAKVMQRNSLQMGVFVAHTIYWDKANLASGNLDDREEFLHEISESVEVAKRVNAKWMTVVPGLLDFRLNKAYQTANVIESLKQASAILEPHDLVMVLEPLNFRDHPGLFLSESPQAYSICKSVDSPSCKILFDIYHQQITEGNIIPNIDACWDEIAYFQIGDNPGRNEPTTGEINYKNVFKHIYQKQFKGILGMEHGNSQQGKQGEERVIDAYVSCDDF